MENSDKTKSEERLKAERDKAKDPKIKQVIDEKIKQIKNAFNK